MGDNSFVYLFSIIANKLILNKYMMILYKVVITLEYKRMVVDGYCRSFGKVKRMPPFNLTLLTNNLYRIPILC